MPDLVAPDRELLLAMIGHELASAAQGVLFGTMFLQQVSPPSYELTAVAEAAARVTRLSRDLSSVLDHRASGLATDARRLDLVSFVPEWVRVARATRDPARAARVRLECAPGRAEVSADPRRLTQILENRLDNAFKYGAAGGDVVVRVAAGGAGVWTVSVLDQGAGVPTGAADELFRPYQRLGASDDVPGSGLGLAICQYLASLMGARLQYCRAGSWSEFFLELPAIAGRGP